MPELNRFKFVMPILKTRVEVRKDGQGNEKEVRFVEGVASSTDKDLHGDRMDPSAIKSMADSLKFHQVPLNADHDTTWSAEIGPIVKLEADEKDNLILEAELSEMSKADDLWYALTTQKKKLGLSIGGYVKEYEMVKEETESDDSSEDDEPKTRWYRLYKDIDLDHVAVTSSPANPKTWVSAISKSIDKSQDELMIKELEEKGDKTRSVKELARKIARKVQEIEADLLLEMTESVLLTLNTSQLEQVEKYLNTIERKMSMDKKVSLDAEEAKAKADAQADAQADEGKDETSATLDTESSDKTSKDAPADTETPSSEDKDVTDDKVGDTSNKDGADASAEEGDEDDEIEESSDTESQDKDGEDEGDSSTESTDKSKAEEDLGQLIKSLTDNMKSLVESNETLAKRVEELEAEPAERKGISIDKKLGDDTSTDVDAETLKKAMEKEIAQARKDHANDPALFSLIQRIRAKYSLKARDIQ